MSDARTIILDRVDRALRTARIPTSPHADGDRDTAVATSPAEVTTGRTAADAGQLAALRERFATEARALGVDVFIESSPEAVRERLAPMVANRRVASWNPDQLPYGAGALLQDAAFGSAPRAELASAEVGVTGCHGAIAETGSLALISRQGCSRAVSLLPPVHIALVQPHDLMFSMGEFFAARAAAIAGASNLTFVTGPSRTADIELSLTIGVHGPARVAVIVGP
jgi:L-lactate dehydrogenase complex protein LldG